MPGVQTYTLIQEQTLSSSAASVTFSSIPQIYEDLVLETIVGHASDSNSYYAKFNGDSGSNYSVTCVWGDGSQARSYRGSNTSSGVALGYYVTPGTAVETVTLSNIMSYSNPNVFKTVVGTASRASNATYTGAEGIVTMWRSTSAITSITIQSAVNLQAGSTFRLYGIVG